MRLPALLGVLLAGCGSAAIAERPLRDFRCAIHVHSSWSHDSKGRMEEILAAAKKAGIDAVVMTEHPQEKPDRDRSLREGWTGLHDGVLFIQGLELHQQLLAVGVSRMPRGNGRQALIDDIHEQGGLAFVSHPEEVESWDVDRFDGMEIWNTHAAVTAAMTRRGFPGRALHRLKEDPDHLFLELFEEPADNLARWAELSRTRSVTMIAGNDAHQNVEFGGRKLDTYERSLGFVATHVLAEELTKESILAALKAGRTYVQFEILGSEPWSLAAGQAVEREGYVARYRTHEGRTYPWIYRPGR